MKVNTGEAYKVLYSFMWKHITQLLNAFQNIYVILRSTE